MTARILLADDHDLVRETLTMFLASEGNFDVTNASTLDQALGAVSASGPFDLALLDYNMPGMNGLEGLHLMISASAGKPVALLSGDASAMVVDQAVSAGAAGFVSKTLGAKSMINAVQFMLSGEVYVPFNYVQQAATTIDGLTGRETQVLRCLAEGMSNKEIARQLDLQEVTIKLHVKTLSRKLGARNRTHAAMIARDRNLL